MDGTLYQFENGDYKGSKLEKQVEYNAEKLLKIIWNWETLIDLKEDYWENFSFAFNDKFWLSLSEYFNNVWNINPEWLIQYDKQTAEIFNELVSLGYYIYIVSEAPKIWITRVLSYLKINDIISGIYSWQWNERKSNWLLYDKVIADLWTGYYMVWDQIIPDIIKAKEKWFKTIYVNQNWLTTSKADSNIEKLSEISDILNIDWQLSSITNPYQ